VKYLKGLCGRDCGTRVTIENGHGGGGDSVLKKTIQLDTPYDVCVCLYDTDRMPTVKGHIREVFPARSPRPSTGVRHVTGSALPLHSASFIKNVLYLINN
jgi:hypothetical protein